MQTSRLVGLPTSHHFECHSNLETNFGSQPPATSQWPLMHWSDGHLTMEKVVDFPQKQSQLEHFRLLNLQPSCLWAVMVVCIYSRKPARQKEWSFLIFFDWDIYSISISQCECVYSEKGCMNMYVHLKKWKAQVYPNLNGLQQYLFIFWLQLRLEQECTAILDAQVFSVCMRGRNSERVRKRGSIPPKQLLAFHQLES